MPEEILDIPLILKNYFPQITEIELQREIEAVGQILSFEGGSVIMDFGSYIKLVPLVLKGSIKVVREDELGNEVFLYYLEAGQTCSTSFTCCMMNKKSIIRTTAEEDTTILGIPIRFMDIWMSKYQSWKNFIMLSYDNRITELIKTIDTIAFQKMDERLLDYLDKKSTALGSNVFFTTHQEIATDLNASREAISRLLKQLEKIGKVKMGRNKIELCK